MPRGKKKIARREEKKIGLPDPKKAKITHTKTHTHTHTQTCKEFQVNMVTVGSWLTIKKTLIGEKQNFTKKTHVKIEFYI